MFLLNALLAYRQSWLVHRKWWVWFSIALFSCLCSALCKEIAITSTVVCVVYDYSTHNKVNWAQSIPLIGLDVVLPFHFVGLLVLSDFVASVAQGKSPFLVLPLPHQSCRCFYMHFDLPHSSYSTQSRQSNLFNVSVSTIQSEIQQFCVHMQRQQPCTNLCHSISPVTLGIPHLF